MALEYEFEPLKYYRETLSKTFLKNAEELWDNLVAQSKLDLQDTDFYTFLYRTSVDKSREIDRFVGKLNWALFGVAVCFGVALLRLSIRLGDIPNRVSILTVVELFCCTVVATLCGVGYYRILAAKKNKTADKEGVGQQIALTEVECKKRLEPLYALFDEDYARQLVVRSFPRLTIEPYLREDWIATAEREFNVTFDRDEATSYLGILNGMIFDSPYFVSRRIKMKMVDTTYTGTRTVVWTTTELRRDSDGKLRSERVTHSETLEASVVEPAPRYVRPVTLEYLNAALPELSFSRSPSHVDKMDKYELESFVKEKEKEMESRVKSSVQKAGAFTPLSNVQFDALFHAFDRNDELKFRELFTPIAETNLTALLLNKPFGDDFHFAKRGMINVVSTENSVDWRLNVLPSQYMDVDFVTLQKRFVDAHATYLRRLFFLLAPAVSFPMYVQTDATLSYQGGDNFDCSCMEAEELANILRKHYTPADVGVGAKTIRKASLLARRGNVCVFKIRQHSFMTKKKVSTFPRRSEDGHTYNVDVDWVQYTPFFKDSYLYVRKAFCSEHAFRKMNGESDKYVFRHGIVASCDKELLKSLKVEE